MYLFLSAIIKTLRLKKLKQKAIRNRAGGQRAIFPHLEILLSHFLFFSALLWQPGNFPFYGSSHAWWFIPR